MNSPGTQSECRKLFSKLWVAIKKVSTCSCGLFFLQKFWMLMIITFSACFHAGDSFPSFELSDAKHSLPFLSARLLYGLKKSQVLRVHGFLYFQLYSLLGFLFLWSLVFAFCFRSLLHALCSLLLFFPCSCSLLRLFDFIGPPRVTP